MDEEKKEIIEVEKSTDTEDTKNKHVQAKVVEEPKKEKKGFCIASMVLGIVALVFFCIWYVSIPCAILAIIFGILGIKTVHKGMAIAGLVTGAIGLVISTITIILLFVFGMAMGISEIIDDDYDYNSYRNHHNYRWYDYD